MNSNERNENYENEQVQINDFDRAQERAREMADNYNAENKEATANEEQTAVGEENTPEVQQNEDNSQVDTLALAEKATDEMAKSKEETEKIRAENEQLKNLLKEISEERTEAVEREAVPEFDVEGLTFMDPEEQKKAFSDFARQIADYSRKSTLQAISPLIERSQNAIQSQEEQSVFDELRGTEEFKDIDSLTPQIRKIMENNSVLKNGDFTPEERIATAYLIAQGVENQNNKAKSNEPMSRDEFLKMIDDNPEYSQYLNERNVERLKQNENVPRFSATSGAGNVGINLKERPKSFSDARDFVKKYYK